MNPVDELKKQLEDSGFGGVEPELSGEWQRFGPGKVLRLWSLEVGGLIEARWMDMREGKPHRFKSKSEWSEEERLAFDTKNAELNEAREKKALEVAARCEAIWNNADPMKDSAYLVGKGLKDNYGCRVEHDITLVPVRDVGGKLWSLQRISADGKDKPFMPGGKKSGCFHRMGSPLEGAARIYVCEGAATAASVNAAIEGSSVVAAFDCGNLLAVCRNLRGEYDAEIVVCADDDPSEVGVKCARRAASAVGGRVALPKGLLTGSDWNDLHQAAGLEAVSTQLEKIVIQKKQLIPLEWKYNPKKKCEVPPNEEELAVALAKYYGDTMTTQEGTLWEFVGSHWEECRDRAIKRIKRELMFLHTKDSTMNKIEGAFKHFMTRVDEVPVGVDLFTPNPFCANFKNGTLFITQNKVSREYSMRFEGGHRPSDYLTAVLDYEYSEDWSEENKALTQMLDNVFEGDVDKTEKIRALKQMYGACLVPAFPHLFFVYGGAGTGKSTAIHLAKLLVDEKNTCKVEPHVLGDFNMETMVGKLVNYCTDVTITKPLSDAVLKRIIDRDKERIRRKGIKDVYAPLPPVHIFGGNKIPDTMETGSGAHDRRWTFIEFRRSQLGADGGRPDLNFWSAVRDASPQGLLNFALEGLWDLCQSRGHFVMPQSGKEEMEEWKVRRDPVGLFIREAKKGVYIEECNSKVCIAAAGCGDLKVSRKNMYEAFKNFHKEEFDGLRCMGRNIFYQGMSFHGIVATRDDKLGWCYAGCKIVATNDSSC